MVDLLDRRDSRLAVGLIAACAVAGCQSPLDVGIGLTWDDAGRAAIDAARSPLVWAPAAGALVFQIDDWDHRASEWAVDNTPVFGNPEDAEDASDVLKDVSLGLGIGLTVLSPEPGEKDEFALRKGWRVALGAGALGATSGLTTAFKDATGRERPDGSSDRSLPSAHASSSAVSATLALSAVERHELPPVVDVAGRTALIILPYATGYARVEAERHYPADVLAGIALGNFFAMWVNELLDPEELDGAAITFAPTTEGVRIGITLPADTELAEHERLTARLRAIYADASAGAAPDTPRPPGLPGPPPEAVVATR